MEHDPLTRDRLVSAAPALAAVSWSAILAGAVVTLGLSIVLTGLAAGFGMRLGYAGLPSRASLEVFTPAFGAWAIVVQVLSSGLGGYLAGRLRSPWPIHADEAHFRDTAHGLTVWAVSTVAGIVLAATVIGPYAEHLAEPAATVSSLGLSVADMALRAQRDANIAAQAAFFAAIGLLLSAFTAGVAATIGGLRGHEMHLKA